MMPRQKCMQSAQLRRQNTRKNKKHYWRWCSLLSWQLQDGQLLQAAAKFKKTHATSSEINQSNKNTSPICQKLPTFLIHLYGGRFVPVVLDCVLLTVQSMRWGQGPKIKTREELFGGTVKCISDRLYDPPNIWFLATSLIQLKQT